MDKELRENRKSPAEVGDITLGPKKCPIFRGVDCGSWCALYDKHTNRCCFVNISAYLVSIDVWMAEIRDAIEQRR